MRKTPKVVRHALMAGAERHQVAAGIELREVTLATLLILEELDSPFVTPRADGAPTPNIEIFRALYVFSKPARDVWALLKSGREAFDLAVIEFADTVQVADAAALGKSIEEMIARATSTIVSAEKKTTPLPTPPTPTASAGR